MSFQDQFSGYKPDFISQTDMSKIKREAKTLVKSKNIKLHEALEHVAVEVGFANWHQLTMQRNNDEKIESFFYERSIVVFDRKDAPVSSEISNGFLTEDHLMPFAAEKEFVYGFINKHHLFGDYSHPPTQWRDDTKDVLDSAIQASEVMFDLVWYRVNQDLKLNDKPNDVLRRIKPHTFFPPQYIALRGIFYGVHNEQEVFAW